MSDFSDALATCPLIAILRGITPAEVTPVCDALIDAGYRAIEIPLNSPTPFESIRIAVAHCRQRAVIGAGTVMTVDDVERLRAVGGRLAVSPHFDAAVVRAAKAAGMTAVPGIATPTEAFAALSAGADALKLFPAEMIPPVVVKAMRAVLPPQVLLIPVGGISVANIPGYRAAGAGAFGIGSSLYSPGKAVADVARDAIALRRAIA
jgi:2-dehydro-3-deoxyphosphogalactonate aldolase